VEAANGAIDVLLVLFQLRDEHYSIKPLPFVKPSSGTEGGNDNIPFDNALV
jgi:hypothetical protein